MKEIKCITQISLVSSYDAIGMIVIVWTSSRNDGENLTQCLYVKRDIQQQ